MVVQCGLRPCAKEAVCEIGQATGYRSQRSSRPQSLRKTTKASCIHPRSTRVPMADVLVDRFGLHGIERASCHDSVHCASWKLCGLDFVGLQVSLRRVLGTRVALGCVTGLQ
jgi:hypothetical protein